MKFVSSVNHQGPPCRPRQESRPCLPNLPSSAPTAAIFWLGTLSSSHEQYLRLRLPGQQRAGTSPPPICLGPDLFRATGPLPLVRLQQQPVSRGGSGPAGHLPLLGRRSEASRPEHLLHGD